MARLTTVAFRWKHKEYSTLVTVKPTGADVHYTIIFDHPDLLEHVPDGIVKFYGSRAACLLDDYKEREAGEIINAVATELLVKYS